MSGVIFDAGGLIALERRDRRVFALVDVILRERQRMVIPATVWAQVIRQPFRQVPLWRLAHHEQTDLIPLDRSHAQAVGALLAASRTSDIADAHVIVCAQRLRWTVITSDPEDLARLDASVPLLRV